MVMSHPPGQASQTARQPASRGYRYPFMEVTDIFRLSNKREVRGKEFAALLFESYRPNPTRAPRKAQRNKQIGFASAISAEKTLQGCCGLISYI